MSSLIPDAAAFERRLAGLPVVKHPAREVVLAAGSKTGRLFFLRSGAVEVIKDGEKIANVSAPGSVFGEQAILLDQPHTADVRTLEQSEFYVADAQAMLAGDPTVALYVAGILARRLDAANRSLIEVKHQLQTGESLSVISTTVEKVEELLSYSGDASLVYAGYPYDPFRPDRSCGPFTMLGSRPALAKALVASSPQRPGRRLLPATFIAAVTLPLQP